MRTVRKPYRCVTVTNRNVIAIVRTVHYIRKVKFEYVINERTSARSNERLGNFSRTPGLVVLRLGVKILENKATDLTRVHKRQKKKKKKKNCKKKKKTERPLKNLEF